MRFGLRKDVDWQYIGALLARGDDNDQVACLQAFVRECLSWGTRLQVETQLAFVNLRLTREEREVLAMITYEDKAR